MNRSRFTFTIKETEHVDKRGKPYVVKQGTILRTSKDYPYNSKKRGWGKDDKGRVSGKT